MQQTPARLAAAAQSASVAQAVGHGQPSLPVVKMWQRINLGRCGLGLVFQVGIGPWAGGPLKTAQTVGLNPSPSLMRCTKCTQYRVYVNKNKACGAHNPIGSTHHAEGSRVKTLNPD
jgi:hypothetical protein